jgi:hypothetical protein
MHHPLRFLLTVLLGLYGLIVALLMNAKTTGGDIGCS